MADGELQNMAAMAAITRPCGRDTGTWCTVPRFSLRPSVLPRSIGHASRLHEINTSNQASSPALRERSESDQGSGFFGR